MRDTELYSRILGIEAPWTVDDVRVDLKAGRVEVHLAPLTGRQPCPECGKPSPGYDATERRWRHLDTCQLQTILIAEVPRVSCDEHGPRQVRVPWAEPGSRFTAMMEALAIDWLREAPIAAVAERLGMSWDEADGIRSRAVARGLQRRAPHLPLHLGVDETSSQRRHEYVTVVIDQSAPRPTVLHVADGRSEDALGSFLAAFDEPTRARVATVTMDMWPPYAAAVRKHIPGGDSKIAYDRFHVAAHLSRAIDEVRRAIQRQPAPQVKGMRWSLLRSAASLTSEQAQRLTALRMAYPKLGRAWAIKEEAARLWQPASLELVRHRWRVWYGWAIRSRLAPIRRVARMVKRHLDGIVTAILNRVSNARAESINATIQKIKRDARGFRNRERFRHAILFHLGGLDLYPSGIRR